LKFAYRIEIFNSSKCVVNSCIASKLGSKRYKKEKKNLNEVQFEFWRMQQFWRMRHYNNYIETKALLSLQQIKEIALYF